MGAGSGWSPIKIGLGLIAGALLLAGCASAGSPSAPASATPTSLSPTAPVSTSAAPSVPTIGTGASASGLADDWESVQAALGEADAQLATAKREGWWAGPVCNPDIELHRENAGQEPLPDEEMRAECAANIVEFWASRDAYTQFQSLDEAARAAESARVAIALGLPAGQEPTVGQVVVVHGCEQGWITDPADCAGIPAG